MKITCRETTPEASASFLEAIDLGIEGLGDTLTERNGRDRPVIRTSSHACCGPPWPTATRWRSTATYGCRLLPAARRA
ncbi:protein of unknown function (plasmid) [Cupriavidus taiwanensis]|uniref:Uncharacterized protein n=1 Tax=Cupriavidus taiwanensis TaxID=164546 RepID=A0A375I7L9_9BURK|nr:hypothetical protein [Cupriavidus taiwanensis]SOY50597.1 hypothetical protein CBM2588_A180251 [Cupriavidus taiwanensis]SOY50877.1 hypothetical protein CBM2592_A230097 [Cupriavidus taiwanensis]SOY83755.1 hypothetical protein CBM2591_A270107 [Cupriavidus taiwanensis]SOZ14255.1 hypothetical protein CBM2604_A120343 [Cupriavidus taiwanensis]SOZ25620.1 hypothetical protein CBM2609_A140345 [Cupriavidus taiwanensis]